VTDTVFNRSGGEAYLVEELAGAVVSGDDPADLPPSLVDVLLPRVELGRNGTPGPKRLSKRREAVKRIRSNN
jgi:hypothetical protein